MRINAARLEQDLTTLATIGRGASGGITRTSFSPADHRAREWYLGRCREAGLSLRHAGIGNMVAGRPGADRDQAAVWSGSHLDTVPDGGPLDGALGAVAALECLRRITEEGVELRRPVEAVVFADEEGNYGHLLGSRALVDGYSADALAGMTGRDGDRLVDVLAASPWADGPATDTRISAGSIHAFVELHIEQGPRLEAAGVDIGVVSSIVGLGGGTIEFRGRADHAGTTPMTERRDALSAAASLLTRLPGIAGSVSPASVITCGILRVEPGGANVVPGRVELTIDFRDPDPQRLHALSDGIAAAAVAVAQHSDVTVTWHPTDLIPPVPLAPEVRELISRSAADLGLTQMALPSGAGHDSQNLARLVPTGMVFIPSAGGRSHSPAEHSTWRDIENGANTLLATILRLAGD